MGVRSLADVMAYELAHADTELAHFGHERFEQAVATGGRAGAAYAAERGSGQPPLGRGRPVSGPALVGADVLIAPAYGPAWKCDLVVGGHAGRGGQLRHHCRRRWPDGPSSSVPIGLVHGLPIGLALIARPGGEWTLLDAARQVEDLVTATGPLPGPTWSVPTPGVMPALGGAEFGDDGPVVEFVLPRMPASAGALIGERSGGILILKPTYKSGWTVPGGQMEEDGETPWEGADARCRRRPA